MDARVAYARKTVSCKLCGTNIGDLFGQCSSSLCETLTRESRERGPYRSGEYIFHEGQGARSIYFVREGTVKCERVSSGGGVHVAGFYLAGDMFGGEDIGKDTHSYDAIALEQSRICEISIGRLEKLLITYPELQHCFLRRISDRIRSSEKILSDSFHLRAKHRLMGFLCDFYTRLSQRKSEMGTSILLPMNKSDIANHLGISPETLSRLLRELEAEGKLRNGLKKIELIEPEQIAHHCKR